MLLFGFFVTRVFVGTNDCQMLKVIQKHSLNGGMSDCTCSKHGCAEWIDYRLPLYQEAVIETRFSHRKTKAETISLI